MGQNSSLQTIISFSLCARVYVCVCACVYRGGGGGGGGGGVVWLCVGCKVVPLIQSISVVYEWISNCFRMFGVVSKFLCGQEFPYQIDVLCMNFYVC